MAKFEIAEILKEVNIPELAAKTDRKMSLTDVENEAVKELDAAFKEIGKTGYDKDHEIAAFTTKVVNQEIYDEPDELLDSLFDRGTIGEFDDYDAVKLPPQNTLTPYEAAHGGNVPRSYLDFTVLKPDWKNYQIETDISFKDLARNGWKTVATLTEYATKAFRNRQFQTIFDVIDRSLVTGAPNVITLAVPDPTAAAVNELALYLNDRAEDGGATIVARSKYIQTISDFPSFTSDEMINEVNRTGRLGVYKGVSLIPISSAKKLGDGTGLIADKRIFGIAGKIGTLDQKGEIKVYEEEQMAKEVIHTMFKDFQFGYAFNETTLDNVAKIVLA